ncbi:MAG TPA: transposase [Chloroflexota bacterium]|nr:transposase [Chloroflexota bacterium]
MSVASAPPTVATTEHGLLVPLGTWAQQIGLVTALGRVPFKMKTVDHGPGDKLAELLVHILAGGMHLKELETAPHPLVYDHPVARAWGQAAFASASGVSALLRAATEESVAGLKREVRQVLAPYRRRVLRDLSPAWLVVDVDLTGLVVSDQATTYEGADFGYMGAVDGPAKGYQFARAQLSTPRESWVLGGFLHPGRTIAVQCLAELVTLVEAELGRPRRRVEVVAARAQQARRELATIEQAIAERARGPVFVRRRQKRLEAQRERRQAEVAALQARSDQLAADNAANPNPRRIILRLDGGFGDAAHLAWLYEQGYDFVARPHSYRVGEGLRREEGLRWEKISKNGFIAESQRTTLGKSPYPVRLFACRQWRGEDQPERWSALVTNPELRAEAWPVRRVGTFYNERQAIEAGIKEGKGLFASRHLPTRHRAGIALYQELVLLAQNLIRWFRTRLGRPWLAAGVKELVRIGANSRALLVDHARGTILQFVEDSPWRGRRLPLRQHIAYQLWFPFLEDRALAAPGP